VAVQSILLSSHLYFLPNTMEDEGRESSRRSPTTISRPNLFVVSSRLEMRGEGGRGGGWAGGGT